MGQKDWRRIEVKNEGNLLSKNGNQTSTWKISHCHGEMSEGKAGS